MVKLKTVTFYQFSASRGANSAGAVPFEGPPSSFTLLGTHWTKFGQNPTRFGRKRVETRQNSEIYSVKPTILAWFSAWTTPRRKKKVGESTGPLRELPRLHSEPLLPSDPAQTSRNTQKNTKIEQNIDTQPSLACCSSADRAEMTDEPNDDVKNQITT